MCFFPWLDHSLFFEMTKRAADEPPTGTPPAKVARMDGEEPPSFQEIKAAGLVLERAFNAACREFADTARPTEYKMELLTGLSRRESYRWEARAWDGLGNVIVIRNALAGCTWWKKDTSVTASLYLMKYFGGQVLCHGDIALTREMTPETVLPVLHKE